MQVFSPKGEPLGIIELHANRENLTFSGKDRRSLYVVGRGAVFRIETLTRGPSQLR